jgi:hypothetical protein
VAITAINTNVANVMLMAKLNRLLSGYSSLRHERRSIHLIRDPAEKSDDEYGSENAELRYRVRAGMENLRHLSTFKYRERQTENRFELSNAEKPKDTLIP